MNKHARPSAKHLPPDLVILHEDKDILVVCKPPGLLTISTETEKSKTAYFILTDYVRKGNAKSRKRLFIVHRLDKDTSGVLIFAKSVEAKQSLQCQWDNTKKTYLAVVHGTCKKRSDIITSWLAENSAHDVYSTSDHTQGKLSRTAYTVLKETKEFSLLGIDLLTGRKNQIRVHLADIGHPVVGDQKYGKHDKAHKRLALHAQSISFKHPYSGEQLTFEAKVPEYFNTLVGRIE